MGSLRTLSVREAGASNWILGCETLDRDMTDYDQYKAHLPPLGIKRLRLQGGWAKTEKEKGKYPWAWLDHIINDAVARGCEPWLQFSYGNPVYPGGGGINLAAGIPSSQEALSAWDRWVRAMVSRYKGKVKEWEIWNEPNFGDNTINKPEDVAELNIRTALIVKGVQPDAIISGLSLGHIDLGFAEAFFRRIDEQGKMDLFDCFTYHDYVYNPDSNYGHVKELQSVLRKYSSTAKLRQGENGAPSRGGSGRGALGDYNWTEVSQAKWNTRRMIGNFGHNIECSILGIIDMNYNQAGPITKLNVKGLIESDSTKRALRPKISYYAVQHVASLLNGQYKPVEMVRPTYNPSAPVPRGEIRFSKTSDRSVSVYGFRHTSGKIAFAIWMDESIPVADNNFKEVGFTFIGVTLDDPVYVDIISGNVYEIPAERIKRKGVTTTVERLPLYDAPIVVMERSLVSLK